MPANIPAVSTTGVWYRHVRAGAPPMPGHPAADGRWQRGEQLAGLYLAEDAETVWAARARRARREGVLFFSSARPAGLCVCVFGTGEAFAGVQPFEGPERIRAAPVPPRGMRT